MTLLLLLETALLDDETFMLLEVALLLATEVFEVETGLAIVLSLRDDEDEVFFELDEIGLLVDLAAVFEDEVVFLAEDEEVFLDEDVIVDFRVVTTLTWVLKVDFAVVFFVYDDFFFEDDFLVEVVL